MPSGVVEHPIRPWAMAVWLGAVSLCVMSLCAVSVCAASEPAKPAKPVFSQQTKALGVDFNHRNFGTGEKYMPENMGPGLAVFDADGDNRLDLFFVQGAPVDPKQKTPAPAVGHRLFLQQPDGSFRQADSDLGKGIGMGVCHGDVDRDGDIDLFVSQFGQNLLLRNQGDGSFQPQADGFRSTWSTGCTFFDPDLDGDLDLFVASYVDFGLDNHRYCGNAAKKLRSYCHPDVYGASPDAFYLNDGQGRFRDVSLKAGVHPSSQAKGLGILAADFNGDHKPDLFVANDSTMNQLYLGNGRGGFEESALLSGVGFNRSGNAEAGMGVQYGDLDGDGRAELFLTHLDRETNTLYRPLGDGLFTDATDASGLAAPSLPWVGFGTTFLDYDLDGDLDIAVVNGHILDNIHLFSPDRSYRQPAQLFENKDGRFRERAGALQGTDALVGRGLVAADLDGDGDEDLVLTQNDGPAMVLRNESPPGHWIRVRLQGKASNVHGIGARVVLKLGERTLVREVLGASGYLSQGPPELVFGLGDATQADRLSIQWPAGTVQKLGPVKSGVTVDAVEPDASSVD